MTCASHMSVTIAHGAYLYSVVQNMTIAELQNARDWIDPAKGECVSNWDAWQARYPNLVEAAKAVQNIAFNEALNLEI